MTWLLSLVKPTIDKLRMLKTRLANISPLCGNSNAHPIRHTARGFRPTRYFKTAIDVQCGGMILHTESRRA